ncbi:MAG: hypothetical protein WDO16_00715 [Bacteroidota bacterium]
MNLSLVKTVFFKTLFAGIALMMPFSFSMRLAAQEPADIEILTALRVKFIGGDNEALFFNVKYNNKDGSNFKLLVLDETGEALFEDSYSKDLDKKLKVPRLTDSDHVIFLIKSAKENAELSYKVRVTTKVVDEAMAIKN